MATVLVIFTCFNRKEKTERAIQKIVKGNPECCFKFIIVDDNSTDGTQQMLKSMKNEFDINVLEGNGNLFYSGGMRLGMDYALLNCSADYLLMMNDDVDFMEGSIQKMIHQSKEQNDSIIVGAMVDENGMYSYGAIKYVRGFKYRRVDLKEWKIDADTFNANGVIIPFKAFIETGKIDEYYIHSLGDFDYGLELRRNGWKIHVSKEYVGLCNNNSRKGTWTDRALPRKVRIQKKEDPKGAPTKQWFYFLKKNFGLLYAVKGVITPYIRIILGM